MELENSIKEFEALNKLNYQFINSNPQIARNSYITELTYYADKIINKLYYDSMIKSFKIDLVEIKKENKEEE